MPQIRTTKWQLERARCASARYDQLIQNTDSAASRPRGERRDFIRAELGMGDRNADRYTRILSTHAVIQNAVEGGQLTLSVAERVAGLATEQQDEIVQRVERGERVAAVVKEYIDQADRDRRGPTDQVFEFAKRLRRAREVMPRCVDDLDDGAAREANVELFGDFMTVLPTLRDWTISTLQRNPRDEEIDDAELRQAIARAGRPTDLADDASVAEDGKAGTES